MKNVYEVLRQKELELSRLEKEVEALRVAAPLLSEDKEAGNDNKPTLAAACNPAAHPNSAAGGQFRSASRPRRRVGRHRQALALSRVVWRKTCRGWQATNRYWPGALLRAITFWERIGTRPPRRA